MPENPKYAVTVAHDYQCPWCLVAILQAKQLASEFPQLTFDWKGYELLPKLEGLPPRERPARSQRLIDLSRAEGINLPAHMPDIVSTQAALEGAEFVKDTTPDRFETYNETV